MMRRWMVWMMAATWLCGGAAAHAQCIGDCDGARSVLVNELVTGVSIALSRAPLDRCPSFDINGDGRVVVNELIVAVGNALVGCGFTGNYRTDVALAGGAIGRVALLANANGQASGSLTIIQPAAFQALQSETVAGFTGSFDPANGSFSVEGSYMIGGETITIRLTGTLGSGFTLQIGDAIYSSTFASPATPTPTPTSTPSGAVHMITVGQPELPFEPEVVEIDPGDTVVWKWIDGSAPHSVRSAQLNSINQPSCTATGLFDSGIKTSGTFSYTFTTPGRYGFHCGVPGHCEAFEYGYIDVRGTPSPTVTRTWTVTPTIAIPTATATPELIGGVSTRMIGTFSGTATIGVSMLAARLQIQVNESGVTVFDQSTFPSIFPNPVQMMVVSPTSLSYQSGSPPPTSFTLSLNDAGHLTGSYIVTDPIMPHLPIAFDLTRDP